MTPRTIITLALMQMLTVFLGVMLTAILLRFLTTDWPNEPTWMPAFPRLMRNYGFLLLLLPVAWAGASVASVRSLDALPQIHRGYLIAGYVVWAVLILVFTFAAGGAYESGLGGGPKQMQSISMPPRSLQRTAHGDSNASLLVPKLHLGTHWSARLYFVPACPDRDGETPNCGSSLCLTGSFVSAQPKQREVQLLRPVRSQVQLGNEGGGTCPPPLI